MSAVLPHLENAESQEATFQKFMEVLRRANPDELSKWRADPATFESLYAINRSTGDSIAQRVLETSSSDPVAYRLFLDSFNGGAYVLSELATFDSSGEELKKWLNAGFSKYIDQQHPITEEKPFQYALRMNKICCVDPLFPEKQRTAAIEIEFTISAMERGDFGRFTQGVRFLIENDSLNLISSSGTSLIHEAVTSKDQNYLNHLLREGVNLNLLRPRKADRLRLTPVYLAYKHGLHDRVALLEAAGADMRQIARSQRKETLRSLIADGVLKYGPEYPYDPHFHGWARPLILSNPTGLSSCPEETAEELAAERDVLETSVSLPSTPNCHPMTLSCCTLTSVTPVDCEYGEEEEPPPSLVKTYLDALVGHVHSPKAAHSARASRPESPWIVSAESSSSSGTAAPVVASQ